MNKDQIKTHLTQIQAHLRTIEAALDEPEPDSKGDIEAKNMPFSTDDISNKKKQSKNVIDSN
jgi:hypothetical protein